MIEKLADLGDLFRQFRDQLSLTQEALAKKSGDQVNRTQIALLEQGRRVPKPEALATIAKTLGIPPEVWAPFAREESHQRQQLEGALGELVGRPLGLRSMALESMRAAELTIQLLFSGNLTAAQAFDTLNSVLVFYAVSRMSRPFFDRYITASAFQSLDSFERGVYRFQLEAVRLFSTFAEAYRQMNAAETLAVILRPLEQRSLVPYTERTVWEHSDPAQAHLDPIVALPEEKLEYLGYISVAKYRSQRKKRETLAKYLRDLASDIRQSGNQALEQLTEKRRRKLDSLLRELGSTLSHTPMSPLFTPNAADLETEANRILRQEKDENEMEQAQSQALSNLSHYLSADYMDVYVATSMRTQSDYISVNRFARHLFRHEDIAPLRLRYFNPTQSWIEDRVAKGLVEALMLRRASVTLYMAQKGDSFGKDSEASVALGQGKPVIVYVPRLFVPGLTLDSDALMGESDARLRETLVVAGTQEEDLDDLDHDALFAAALTHKLRALEHDDLAEIVKLHWADFALLDESDRIRGKDELPRREAYTTFVKDAMAGRPTKTLGGSGRDDLVSILVATTINFEKRARLFKAVHPLALQIILSTGVLNGILVARSIDSCARVLKGLLENKLDLELHPEPENYRLVEKSTGSTVRVIARNVLLSNALDTLYVRAG